MLKELEKSAVCGVLDYQLLMSHLKDYKAPHRKITELLKSGNLVRLKKGLYVLGKEYREEPINHILIANLIYGPSYVSQEYALQYYGLIPERVETVTSMTCKRNKYFDTPLGCYSYTYINQNRFTVGIDWLSIRKDFHVLIASPEKAIADSIISFRDLKTEKELREHLLENMRMDEDLLKKLDLARLTKIEAAYRHPVIKLFYKTIKRGL